MASLTVATVQLALRAESSPDQLLEHMRGLVNEAVEQGGEVVLFPELASTGLLGVITDHDVTTETVASDYWHVLPTFTDRLVQGMSALAQEHRIVILGGSHNRVAEDGSLRNTAYVLH